MLLKVKVPNIACEACGEKITESIHTMEPDAQVNVDVKSKIVTVESQASEESIKQVIVAAGYNIEGY
ncbi:heavy-metal-associated domain-containing protein [Nostoc sp. CENA67]|uniref:Heavy-metal-associated domain-containing protein n=1 Tax=Amazonocrinis nigriterrae CENA67 TaxID=2794033 RepID=A0A8J7HXV9_9NOST|nr:heavy-metal-associated domain-containing protein [Amazonocrinis nigriterrae]MBH8567067.1 heavy-metal-associated domain-containing protein [Amazonocrinis nigriterrae CENA67]